MGRRRREPEPAAKQVRCAIYTRKSTEEGLQQDFNSLDAQRESGEAYIASQKNEGWVCLPDRYDDGGFTGGNMDRPALARLLADIEAGKLDCVVVYKVDRLSRSLLDFSKIMEKFDGHGVSFVSVTQHFNTTDSMGRLTLNILLSFAQFEREIISERTRDKIAAARRRGKWSGGKPLLGYDLVTMPGGSRLIVNGDEAARVRAIFEFYLEHERLAPVLQELDRREWRTKRWTTRKGTTVGGRPFDKVTLYRFLTNPAFLRKVKHHDDLYDGEHDAIVDAGVWQRASALLQRNGRSGGGIVKNKYGALLKGLLRCVPCDSAMIHSMSSKGSKRYRYYVCAKAMKRGWYTCPSKSVPAGELERFVVDQIRGIGRDPGVLARTIRQVRAQSQKAIADLDRERRTLERDITRQSKALKQHLAAAPESNGADVARQRDELRRLEVRLRVADLYPQGNNGHSLGQIVATYDYRTGQGELLFQVVRYAGKKFRQRRPDGNGGWIWKLGRTPRVLYRLPELLATGADEWVVVAEGEKDVDRLTSAGLIATCNPGGAGKWSKLSDDSALHNRRVAIIADKDEAGRKHAADVAMRLRNRAREIRVIELPGEGKDASDWFDAGGDVRRLLELVEQAAVKPESANRPQIQSNERQLRNTRADALAALLAANNPPRLFTRTGGVARVALVQNEQKEPVPVVQQLDADGVRGELTDAADWFTLKHSKQGGDFLVPDLPPLAVARDILAQPRLDLPPLTAVITCPTFAPDGSLITDNGYHSSSALWLHSSIADLPPVPDAPDAQVVAAAREALLDIVADFPFVDDASRANAIALMLLPFVRPMIAGPTPLHAADSPSPATGKDLLVKAALLPALGYEVGATTAAKDPDEWRKKITSTLVGGSPAILWGNVARRMDSEHLAAVLTDIVWRDRQLGHTRELTLPNRAVWAATGNNLAFSRELARRVVWIRLDAKMETPEQRTGFRHPNLPGYVREHRADFIHAALTLVRAWLAAGRPVGAQVMGSFESYAAIMGGILDVVGVPGFLANADELRRQADEETADWRVFVLVWWERWHDAKVGVSDLAALLWEEGGKRTDLLTTQVAAPTERGALTQLGMRLARKRDCVVAGFRVTSAQPDKSGRRQYRLVPLDGIPLGGESQGMPKVCPEVCQLNLSNDGDLQSPADLGIPFSRSQRAYAGAHTRARAHEGDPARRSARSAVAAQSPSLRHVAPADLGADLRQTSSDAPGRSAGGTTGDNGVAWYSGAADQLPKAVIELARPRDGWTPSAWRERLLQLAERCEATNPDRAAELRQAAEVMTRSMEQSHGA